MRYYLGIDNGGTMTKAGLFAPDGKEIGVAGISAEMITPKPGYVERDMEEMWEANCRVIRDVIKSAGIDGKEIAGIGICGHGKGLYLWGKDGKPARNGIVSSDNRAYSYVEKWKADGTEEKIFPISCQHIMACQPAALLAWLRDHEPETYRNIQYVFECKDYVRYRLTGEAKAELTDYSGTNLLNLHTRQYDEELLRLFGIADIKETLPPLCESAKVCGYVTEDSAQRCGLRPGTPVAGGMFDIDACALAVGLTDEKDMCMIAGTWSINEYLRREAVLDGSVKMNSLFCLPEYFLIEESSPTSAGNNEWFIRQLLPEIKEQRKKNGESIYDVMNEWVESVGVEEFTPIFLPFLMASNVHPKARAAFVGINVNHTRKHMVRSVYEGIVFCHKMHLERLLRSRRHSLRCVRLAGGAARSKVWAQMFADILEMPVETVAVNETGTLGSAIAAAAAVGEYADLKEASSHMCSVSSTVRPSGKYAEFYRKKYELYKKTIRCLDSLWDDMQILAEGGEKKCWRD